MASQWKRRRYQFSLAALLGLQTVVAVAMAIWKGLGAGVLSIMILFGSTIVLLAAGTVGIASDLSRARVVWGYFGRLLTIGFAVFVLFVLVYQALEALGVVP
jgi:hypothetical protein